MRSVLTFGHISILCSLLWSRYCVNVIGSISTNFLRNLKAETYEYQIFVRYTKGSEDIHEKFIRIFVYLQLQINLFSILLK